MDTQAPNELRSESRIARSTSPSNETQDQLPRARCACHAAHARDGKHLQRKTAGLLAVSCIAWLGLGPSIQVSRVALVRARLCADAPGTKKDDASNRQCIADESRPPERGSNTADNDAKAADEKTGEPSMDSPSRWLLRRWTKARLYEVLRSDRILFWCAVHPSALRPNEQDQLPRAPCA